MTEITQIQIVKALKNNSIIAYYSHIVIQPAKHLLNISYNKTKPFS